MIASFSATRPKPMCIKDSLVWLVLIYGKNDAEQHFSMMLSIISGNYLKTKLSDILAWNCSHNMALMFRYRWKMDGGGIINEIY